MQISEKTIKEFQDIFEKKYGKRLSREEAIESTNNLLRLFEILYEIDCKKKQSKRGIDGLNRKTNKMN